MNINGFTDYNVDLVIKFGGSLLEDQEGLVKAISALDELLAQKKRILVIPGGGPTDNTIESLDKRHPFHVNTHHRACARAQDQTGLMISDPVFSTSLEAVETLEEMMDSLSNGKVAVLLPSKTIFTMNPFEKTWDITSDAMAAWYAWVVDAQQLIILTNVDGVHSDPTQMNDSNLIEEIYASDLEEMGHTAVDKCTPLFLKSKSINCWIINGAYPDRIVGAATGQVVKGTYVKG